MSELIGKIIVLNDTQVVGSAGTFKKRTLVIETEEQYKQTIPIDFVQDKCDVLNSYKVGENVKVLLKDPNFDKPLSEIETQFEIIKK